MHIRNEDISIVITLMCFGLTDLCIHTMYECNHVIMCTDVLVSTFGFVVM